MYFIMSNLDPRGAAMLIYSLPMKSWKRLAPYVTSKAAAHINHVDSPILSMTCKRLKKEEKVTMYVTSLLLWHNGNVEQAS